MEITHKQSLGSTEFTIAFESEVLQFLYVAGMLSDVWPAQEQTMPDTVLSSSLTFTTLTLPLGSK